MEVCEGLGLYDLRNRIWHIQGTCATSGEGLYEGLDWLATTLKELKPFGRSVSIGSSSFWLQRSEPYFQQFYFLYSFFTSYDLFHCLGARSGLTYSNKQALWIIGQWPITHTLYDIKPAVSNEICQKFLPAKFL